VQKTETIKGAYYDSVTLMLAARELNKLDGVSSSSFSMGTEANLRIMEGGGFDTAGLDAAPNDLIIGVLGDDADKLTAALETAKEYLAKQPWKKDSGTSDYKPKSLDGALSILPGANLAVVSVAGRYAGDLAESCLKKGLNVMLFSDNVPLEKEIELKKLAREKNLLVMGPDCGTVVIRGKALGMANVCPTGPVGIVAAAGTGLQEAHIQLERRGVGTLHGIGTGGRDVKREVGGLTALAAMEALISDDEIRTLLVVGKPPAPEIEQKIADVARKAGKPVILGFVGGITADDEPPVYFCSGLEESAAVTAALTLGTCPADARRELGERDDKFIAGQLAKLGSRRGCLRGLYSGGTLCYEAQLVASAKLGAVWSNAPLDARMKLADSLTSKGHTIVDYGEDEFTQGKLHPMIDGAFRCERVIAEARDPEVSVILLDVVLGHGCNENPAGIVSSAVGEAREICGDRIAFVASVCGTDADPQNASAQRRILEDAGVVVCASNAQAALLASSLIEGGIRA